MKVKNKLYIMGIIVVLMNIFGGVTFAAPNIRRRFLKFRTDK